ncbi:hypothetical protein KAW50_02020 [candidate division WOR-3 bacterium]|nr:hypothetical protein [candidate division WOR-3 bacterium]
MSIEWIKDGEQVLAVIIPFDYNPSKTEFITPLDYKQQLGFIVYESGESITPHLHIPMNRNLIGTSEVLFIKSGKVKVDLYTKDKKLVATRTLNQGDIILLVSGGHGFRMLKDTIMLEVKQGPYIGVEEKERFNS